MHRHFRLRAGRRPAGHRARALHLNLIALAFSAAPALAQSCSFTQGPIDFGAISLSANAAVNITGALSVSCTGVARRNILICSHLGAGTGGASATAQRAMLAGTGDKLNFNLFKNSTYSTIWGSSWWGLSPTAHAIRVTLDANGRASASLPIYARINAGQRGARGGSYASSFTGTDARVAFAYSGTDCTQVGTSNAVSVPLQASATVLSSCTAVTRALNFGSASLLRTSAQATATLTVTCSQGTAYSIRLGKGQANAADSAARRMVSAQGNSITYGLYRDAARTQGWGDLDSNDMDVAAATGAAQNFTIYGTAPRQRALPGSYADTILVEIAY